MRPEDRTAVEPSLGCVRVGARSLQLWHRPGTADLAIFDEVLHGYRLEELLAAMTSSRDAVAAVARGQHLVDIGAHIGSFSLLAAMFLPDATVDAYEMMPDNAELLRANVAANGLGDRIRVHNVVVADSAGWWDPADHRRDSDDNTGGRSVAWCDFAAAPVPAGLPVVPSRQVLAGRRVDLLKIDCEASEFRILYSAGDALDNVERIVGELHDAGLGRWTNGHRWDRTGFLDCLRQHYRTVTTWDRKPRPWGHSEQFLAQR